MHIASILGHKECFGLRQEAAATNASTVFATAIFE
jgi:hypothetical protein